MEIEVIMYGLLHLKTHKLMRVTSEKNTDRESNDSTWTLTNDNGGFWLVDSFDKAEYIRKHQTDWWDSDYDRPVNDFRFDELEAVEVSMKIS